MNEEHSGSNGVKSPRVSLAVIVAAALLAAAGPAVASPDASRWVGAWVSAQQLTEPRNLPPAPGLAGRTLRQVIQPSLSGNRLRITLSNAFGDGPVGIAAAHVARSTGGSAIDPRSDAPLTFHGATAVTIEPGAAMISDPVDFTVAAFQNLAVTIAVASAPEHLTGHPGSRETSFIQPGAAVAAESMERAATVDHWYLLAALDVSRAEPASAVVVLGDSITDGHGATTNGNDRWPDDLAHRLADNPATRNIAVLNQGIGGNRLLRDGLGPNALARFDRDVLAPPGVRWLIVLEGVNDLGTAVGARAHGWPAASAEDEIAALHQIIVRAHSHGLRVYGGTIMPLAGFKMYDSPESEADRQAVNRWIRTSGEFDAVIDFDEIMRDPEHPARLRAAVDSGDHLHPSASGYHRMADAIDPALFAR